MANPLAGSLARTVGRSLSGLFFDAVLERDVTPDTSPDYETFDPPAPVPTSYTCKALDIEYKPGLRAASLVGAKDINILILADTLDTEPAPGDRITISRATAIGPFTIVPASSAGQKAVAGDPARATWSCRCMT